MASRGSLAAVSSAVVEVRWGLKMEVVVIVGAYNPGELIKTCICRW